MRKVLAVMISVMLLVSLTGSATMAKKPATPRDQLRGDNFPGPLARKQAGLRLKAQEMVLAGKAKPRGKNKVVKLAAEGGAAGKGIFVELAFEGEDQILTLLGEFGDGTPTHSHGSHGGPPGPAHNEIPQPDRLGVDNTTIWTSNFNRAYYERLLFDKSANPSMANWYLEQSSGAYSVDGYVSEWVQVPDNAAAYGSNYCGDNVCPDTWLFVEDQANAWYQSLIDDGWSDGEIEDLLATFDVWDRYDYDFDGEFDEPDGYIDHFQSVHSGEDEAVGGGAQGEDAIWSHRWYVQLTGIGDGGPEVGGEVVPFGGVQLGNSSKWIGDYTIEPENGGVGVFVHEYAHDLGLPDEYDTTGNAENSTAWWTVMSQGSYGTVGSDLGSYPTHFNAWDKFQLGFLNYDVAFADVNKQRFTLGPAESNNSATQAVFVVLPPKNVVTQVGTPFGGDWFYDSGSGDDLDNTMTRQMALPGGTVTAQFRGRWHIEPCYDYAYLQISTNGTTFTNVHTSASTNDDPNSANDGEGITGISGTPYACDDDLSPTPVWRNVTADLTPWAGQNVWVRFRYVTDPFVVGNGISIDNVRITGHPKDGAETDPGWDYDGFIRTDGFVTSVHNHYYIAEYRKYIGYDRALKRGPYNYPDPDGEWVEHFPYQDGLLVWYWDTSQDDNDISLHPGEGLILPIDAHPGLHHWSDGSVARPRIQAYDSTFGIWETDNVSLHRLGLVLNTGSKTARPIFDDMRTYWRSSDPGDAAGNGNYQSEWNSVRNPHTGTTIKILRVYNRGLLMDVRVN